MLMFCYLVLEISHVKPHANYIGEILECALLLGWYSYQFMFPNGRYWFVRQILKSFYRVKLMLLNVIKINCSKMKNVIN